MKILAVDNYADFECIGGKCPISCCGGDWNIYIDDKTYGYYMSLKSEFGDKLSDGIVDKNGKKAFRLDEKTRECVFLNEDKLCTVYRTLGPDALCETCKTYPRVMYRVGDIVFCFLTNSCPEVNRMVFQRTDTIKTILDDSNNLSLASEIENMDWKLFNDSIKAYTTGMQIIQSRELPFRKRLIVLLLFTERFQELVRQDKETNDVITVFSNPQIYTLLLENYIDNSDYASKIRAFIIIYRSLMYESYEHSMWDGCRALADDIIKNGIKDVESVEKAFTNLKGADIEVELEQIMAYRFFAVFMQGFFNTDYLDRLEYEIIMCIVLEAYVALSEAVQGYSCSQEDRIVFYSLCGRIDHAKKRQEKLIEEFRQGGLYEMDKLIGMIG